MRPRSIVLFDWLYLGSLLGSLLSAPLSYSKLGEMSDSDPALAAMAGSIGTFFFVSMGIALGISLLLWFFVSRKASNIAKWILVAFTAIGVVGLVPSLQEPMFGGTQLAITIVLTLLQVVAAALLFRPDAREWFEGKPPVDPDVFN